MTKRAKYTVSGVIVLIIVVVILGFLFSGGKKKPSLETVRIGSFSTAIDYAPYLVAKSQKWFEEELRKQGVNVEYTTFESLPPINESFETGRVDAVFEAEPPAIVGRAAGIDIRIIGISCSLTQEIIVPSTSTVKEASELKGKKIAVLAGTSSHYGLLKIAQAAGLTNNDLKIIDLRPPDAKSAFETGQVDGWAVWPPWVEQEIIAGKGRVLPKGDAQIHSILAVRGPFADAHPDLASSLVAVLERAKEWIRNHPSEAQQIVAQELNLDPKVVALSWSKHAWDAQLTDAVTTDIQAKADFLSQQGTIRRAVNVKTDLIKPLQAVVKP